ncbi:hypothetical protein SAMN06269250_3413 [Spirosoma fluviale]|uniref:Uncharacterized protein n=1 Tax=Spirosoma fluviale TaxID=1597977 RepID=A0A286G4G8_9BACT|nr:hypothetical protein SAMN06269250_3413 [Spirosoma fluviale]
MIIAPLLLLLAQVLLVQFEFFFPNNLKRLTNYLLK